MKVLPIKFLGSEDKNLFGEEMVNLASLHRKGIPIAAGYAILPPEEILSEFKKNPNRTSLQAIKEEFKKNPYQEELFVRLKNKKLSQKMWDDLIDRWFLVLEQELEKGESPNFGSIKLFAQPVYLTDQVLAAGEAYVDKNRGLVEVKIDEGSLRPEQFSVLEELIKHANSELLLDYLFNWILEGGEFKVVKLRPFTQNYEAKNTGNFEVKLTSDLGKDMNETVFKTYKTGEFDENNWVLIETPEAFMKMENSEGEGKGFLVDFDKIYGLLRGSEEFEVIDQNLMKNFFAAPLKEVLAKGKPVLFKGNLVTQDGVLRFLIKSGVSGILVEDIPAGFGDYIRQLEHLHVSFALD